MKPEVLKMIQEESRARYNAPALVTTKRVYKKKNKLEFNPEKLKEFFKKSNYKAKHK